MRSCFWRLILGSLLLSCSRGAPSGSEGAAGPSVAAPPKESLGNVMAEVARRFEIAGRAASSNRFELAEFEAGEIEELFEDDVPNAELPKEGPTSHIPQMAKTFLAVSAPELKRAAASGDRGAFAVAFQHTAASCNACHQASAKGFIQIPSEPGKSVPDLDPLQPPPAAPR